MRSERGLSTILHCLQSYKLVLRTRLSTAAVQYPMRTLRCQIKRLHRISHQNPFAQLRGKSSRRQRDRPTDRVTRPTCWAWWVVIKSCHLFGTKFSQASSLYTAHVHNVGISPLFNLVKALAMHPFTLTDRQISVN